MKLKYQNIGDIPKKLMGEFQTILKEDNPQLKEAKIIMFLLESVPSQIKPSDYIKMVELISGFNFELKPLTSDSIEHNGITYVMDIELNQWEVERYQNIEYLIEKGQPKEVIYSLLFAPKNETKFNLNERLKQKEVLDELPFSFFYTLDLNFNEKKNNLANYSPQYIKLKVKEQVMKKYILALEKYSTTVTRPFTKLFNWFQMKGFLNMKK